MSMISTFLNGASEKNVLNLLFPSIIPGVLIRSMTTLLCLYHLEDANFTEEEMFLQQC